MYHREQCRDYMYSVKFGRVHRSGNRKARGHGIWSGYKEYLQCKHKMCLQGISGRGLQPCSSNLLAVSNFSSNFIVSNRRYNDIQKFPLRTNMVQFGYDLYKFCPHLSVYRSANHKAELPMHSSINVYWDRRPKVVGTSPSDQFRSSRLNRLPRDSWRGERRHCLRTVPRWFWLEAEPGTIYYYLFACWWNRQRHGHQRPPTPSVTNNMKLRRGNALNPRHWWRNWDHSIQNDRPVS